MLADSSADARYYFARRHFMASADQWLTVLRGYGCIDGNKIQLGQAIEIGFQYGGQSGGIFKTLGQFPDRQSWECTFTTDCIVLRSVTQYHIVDTIIDWQKIEHIQISFRK